MTPLLGAVVALVLLCNLALIALGIYSAYRQGQQAKAQLLVDRRVIQDVAHSYLLRASGACLHRPGFTAEGCDCSGRSAL